MSGAAMSPSQALASAVRRSGHLIAGATALTPFDVMAAREELGHDDEERRIREEAHSEWLAWLFEGRMSMPEDIERVLKRLWSYARRYRPDLCLNMSAEQAAALFVQGRAAQIARENKTFEATLKGAGYRTATLPGAKSAGSRAKMAQAQQGNHTRARSAKKAIL